MSELLLPGFVDLDPWFGEPGSEQAETVASGLLAAVRGGYVLVAPDPHTQPAIDNDAQVSQLLSRGQGSACGIVAMAAAIREGDLSEMSLIAKSGAHILSLGDVLPKDTCLIRSLLEYAAQAHMTVMVHPCDPWLAGKGVVHEGAVAERMGLAGIPAIAEEIALGKLLPLVRLTGARVHLSRISSERGMLMVREAKEQGLSITADVSFRHLLWNETAVEGYDVRQKLFPPLRSELDRKALWAGMLDGTFDAIISGHRPVAAEEKEREFDKSPAGAIGLETCFPLLWSERGHKAPEFSVDQAAEWLCHGPRRVLGLPEAPSTECEASVWREEPWTFETPASRSCNCPELGSALSLRLVQLVRDGQRIDVP